MKYCRGRLRDFFFWGGGEGLNEDEEHFVLIIRPDTSVNARGHLSPLLVKRPRTTQTAKVTLSITQFVYFFALIRKRLKITPRESAKFSSK